MKRLGQTNIQAFSVGYDEESGVPDETDAAEMTAQTLGCNFHRYRVTAEGMEAQLDGFFSALDQPSGDALNTYLVSQEAAKHVKVVISGLGADEWFGGYNYHRLLLLASRSPMLGSGAGQLSKALHKVLPSALKAKKWYKALHNFTGGAGSTARVCQEDARSINGMSYVAQALGTSETAAEGMTLQGIGHRRMNQDEHIDWMKQLLITETHTYLANTLLRDNDCVSMAHSLELRVPFVDKAVFAMAGKIPSSAKLDLRLGKKVLRSAFADMLPNHIRDDSHKKTFTLPMMKWLQHPKLKQRVHDVVLNPHALILNYLDKSFIQNTIKAQESTTATDTSLWNVSQRVWMLIVLESWLQRNLKP